MDSLRDIVICTWLMLIDVYIDLITQISEMGIVTVMWIAIFTANIRLQKSLGLALLLFIIEETSAHRISL